MSQLVICYSRADKPLVDRVVGVLRGRGVDVWDDDNIKLCDDFRTEIRRQIVTASAVLVVWSKAACKSRWVPQEADLADTLHKLIEVIAEACDVPLPFGHHQYGDLSFWDGSSDHREILKIIDAVTKLAAQTTPPSATVESGNVIDNDRAEIQKILDTDFRLKVANFFRKGDISEAFLGQAGTRLVLLKSVSDNNLTEGDKAALLQEVELAAYLQDQTFLRMAGIAHSQGRSIIASDFCNGESISRKLALGVKFSIAEVLSILDQVSKAVAEAHSRGLMHLRIDPSHILVVEDKILNRKIARLSPINFAYFLERRRSEHAAEWRDNSSPYIAPELWEDNSWLNGSEELDREAEARSSAILPKAHQFALGMTAWMMVEGKSPYEVPKRRRALTKIRDFLDASRSFSAQVKSAPWRCEARVLSSIIARMVEFEPAKRWQDMKQVSRYLSAISTPDSAREYLDDEVKEIYRGICSGRPKFYRNFYDRLFTRANHLRAKFPTDMTHQHKMLDFAVGQLLNYAREQAEPTTLTQFINVHRRLGLSADDFQQFGEALIETFEGELPVTNDHACSLTAIEIVVWPGIEYLMQSCTSPKAQGRRPRA